MEELTSGAARAQLEAQRSDSPRAKLAERRAAARHEELRHAASTGLWRVHLLAGAATPEQAEQVAGLLRASTDLAGLPYALLPARPAAPLPGRDRDGGRPARRSLLEEPELQWAVPTAGSAPPRSAPTRPPLPMPSAGLGGGAVAGAAAGRPVLRLHRAGRRAGPGTRPGGARGCGWWRARSST